MEVVPVATRENNYSYILIDLRTKEAAVIDPVEPNKILNYISQMGWKLTSVFITHHHPGHAGGNIELLLLRPGLAVYGADARIPEINYVCKHHEDFKLGNLLITPLHTPCHTKGHICYYVQDTENDRKVVFTGDTLFYGGIGKFYEGDARDMFRILFHIIAELPDDTLVYSGHDFALENMEFALRLEPSNKVLLEKQEALKHLQGGESIPASTIGQEKILNPFMRVNEQYFKDLTKKADPVEVLQVLRDEKNKFGRS